MVTFAKKQRAHLKRTTLSAAQYQCQRIEKSVDLSRERVRFLFKNFAHNLMELIGGAKEIDLNEGFVSCGEEWLKASVIYLNKASFFMKAGDAFEKAYRTTAIELLMLHFIACYFRIEAEGKLLIKSSPRKSSDLIFAENVDEMICRALGCNSISELMK